MKSSRDHIPVGIQEILTDMKVEKLLRDVLAAFANGDRMLADQHLATLRFYGLKVRKLGASGVFANNLNYEAYQKNNKFDDEYVIAIEEDGDHEAEDDDADIAPENKIIIQLCRKTPEGVSADEILSQDKEQEWQAECAFTASVPAADGIGRGDWVYIRAMEYCPDTLDKLIVRLRKEMNEVDCINAARSVGRQLSSVLTTLKTHHLIWTDMKFGNILLRRDGCIVIADTKGIIDPALLPKRKKNSKTLIYGDVSPAYVSKDFTEHRQMNTGDAGEAKAIWDREYSYQLAVTLYALVTASPPLESRDGVETIFDFNLPVFRSKTGERMQYIISRLGNHHLLDRMHHQDADELLRLIYHAQSFEAAKQQAEQNTEMAKQTSLRVAAQFGTRTPEEALKFLHGMQKIEIAQMQLKEERTSHEEARAEDKKDVMKVLRGSGEKLVDKIKKISNPELEISAPISTQSDEDLASPPPITPAGLKPKRDGRGGSGKQPTTSIPTFMSPRKHNPQGGEPPKRSGGSSKKK